MNRRKKKEGIRLSFSFETIPIASSNRVNPEFVDTFF